MTTTTTLFRAAVPAIAALMFAAPASAHEEGNITVATADFFSCAKPIWPAAALAEKRTGKVTLMFEIDAEGRVLRSMVANSSGHADLDEAAREGISKCAFKPGTRDGKPVTSGMRMQYVWTLN
jgi:bla regulator protein BlaR1